MINIEKIQTDRAPAAIGPYSQAVVVGGVVYTSGQIALSPETGIIEAQDTAGQTHQVIKNLREVLAAAGASLDSVIRTACFLADMNDFAEFNKVYETYFTSKPARSCVAVKALPKNALVEIEATACVETGVSIKP